MKLFLFAILLTAMTAGLATAGGSVDRITTATAQTATARRVVMPARPSPNITTGNIPINTIEIGIKAGRETAVGGIITGNGTAMTVMSIGTGVMAGNGAAREKTAITIAING